MAGKEADQPESDAAKQAEEARKSLKLFRVIADRKHRVPAPVLELHQGDNAFELADDEAAKPLLARLAELVASGDVTVTILDGDGTSQPWEPPAKN